MSIFESKDQMPVEPGKRAMTATIVAVDGTKFRSLNNAEVVQVMMTPDDARATREAFWSGYSAMSTRNIPCRVRGKHY